MINFFTTFLQISSQQKGLGIIHKSAISHNGRGCGNQPWHWRSDENLTRKIDANWSNINAESVEFCAKFQHPFRRFLPNEKVFGYSIKRFLCRMAGLTRIGPVIAVEWKFRLKNRNNLTKLQVTIAVFRKKYYFVGPISQKQKIAGDIEGNSPRKL